MTQGKLKPKPPTGSGLTDDLLAEHFAKLTASIDVEALYVVGVLRPVGYQHEGASSRVSYEFSQLEVLTESRGDEGKALIRRERDARGGVDGQMTFPDDDPREIEQKSLVLEAILDHYERNGIDATEAWFGWHDKEFVAEPKKATLLQLTDFAEHEDISYRVLEEPMPEAKTPERPADVEGGPDWNGAYGPAPSVEATCGADVNGFPCDKMPGHKGSHLVRVVPPAFQAPEGDDE